MSRDEHFHVRTTEGVLRSKHGTVAEAEAAMAEANAEAVRLGVKARYEVRDEYAKAA